MKGRVSAFAAFFLAFMGAADGAEARVKACDLLLESLRLGGRWYQLTARDTTRVLAECVDAARPGISACIVLGQPVHDTGNQVNLAFRMESASGKLEDADWVTYVTGYSETKLTRRRLKGKELITAGPVKLPPYPWGDYGRRSSLELDLSSGELSYRFESTPDSNHLEFLIDWTVERDNRFHCQVSAD